MIRTKKIITLDKNLKVVHLVGGEENSGAFKGANLLHEDLINHNVNSKIIYEKDETNLVIIQKSFDNIMKNLQKFFIQKEKVHLSVQQ